VRRLLLVLVLSGCASAPRAPDPLREAVFAALAPAGGEWAVYFKDLQTGEELAHRADDEFHPASTLKIWVMIKVFQDVEDGKYSLDDECEVVRTFPSAARKDPRPFVVEPTSKRVAAAVGGRMKVRDLVEAMITVSDNLATNVLIGRAGGTEAINARLRAFGVTRSGVRRYIMDTRAFEEGLSSSATVRDFGRALELLARGELVSPAASRAMLGVMERLPDRSMLPARLPAGARVAHKTGAIDGVRGDVGLVTLPDGRRYVAAFLARGLRDERKAEACLAEASRLLFERARR
jgi:beta-lactamase class A